MYDWTGLYGTVPDLTPLQSYSWQTLANYSHHLNTLHLNSSLPYVFNGMSGWDALPWGGEQRPRFAFPSTSEWLAYVKALVTNAEASSTGFPLADGSIQPAAVLYAWNEFGEGGMVAPTKGWNFTRLDAIRALKSARSDWRDGGISATRMTVRRSTHNV